LKAILFHNGAKFLTKWAKKVFFKKKNKNYNVLIKNALCLFFVWEGAKTLGRQIWE